MTFHSASIVFTLWRGGRAKLFWAVFVSLVLVSCGGGGTPQNPDLAETRRIPPAEVIATSITLADSPALISVAGGAAWLVWSQDAAGGEMVIAAHLEKGRAPTLMNVSANPVYSARLTRLVPVNGMAVASWVASSLHDSTLWAAVWNGVDWVTEQVVHIADKGSAITGLELIGTANGDVHVVWLEYHGTGFQLLSKRRYANGSWSPQQVIRSLEGGLCLSTKLLLSEDKHGAIMLVWGESITAPGDEHDTRTLWSARFDATSGNWTPSVAVHAGGRYERPVLGADASWKLDCRMDRHVGHAQPLVVHSRSG
ncbi:MAG: hypothetical protein QM742_06560 [Aquabacterium sp.]